VSGQRWISTKQSVSQRRFLTKRRSGSGRRRRGAGAGPRLLEQVRQQSRRSGADGTPMNSSLAGVSSSLASSMVTPTAFRPLLTTRSWSTTIAKTPSSSSITKASASSPRDRDFRKRPTAVFCVRKAAPSISTFSDYERHVVVESTLDGETVWTLNRRKDSGVYEKEEQFKPSNTVVAPNGDIYVADGYGLSYVHQFSPGSSGSDPGRAKAVRPQARWPARHRDRRTAPTPGCTRSRSRRQACRVYSPASSAFSQGGPHPPSRRQSRCVANHRLAESA
jgi:hypothetical protein